MDDPAIKIHQGKTIIEWDGAGYLIMHPDGTVASVATKHSAERAAVAWYRANLGDEGRKIGFGLIEWRDN
jgi:hypothetical protein